MKHNKSDYTPEGADSFDVEAVREKTPELQLDFGQDIPKPALSQSIIQRHDVQESDKPKSRRSKSKEPRILLEDAISQVKIEAEMNPELQTSAFKNKRLFLPTTITELIYFWDRGYICHPAVLFELLKKKYGNYEPCSISRFENINLTEVYNVKFELLIEFESQNASSTVVSGNWITPCNSIKRLVVKDSDTKDSIIRFFHASYTGFTSELDINVENIDSIYDTTKDSNLAFSEIKGISDDIIESFKRLDSCLGGIALSSFIERKLLLNNEHIFDELHLYGYMGQSILNIDSPKYESKPSWKVLDFIVDRIRQELKGGKPSLNDDEAFAYSLRVLEFIRNGDIPLIKECALDYNENKCGKSQKSAFDAFITHLKKREITDAIQKIPLTSKARDPFLIFAAMAGSFINLGVPASNDKQSFLIAIDRFYHDGIINPEEMVISGYLLGSFLSYSLVWNPIEVDERFDFLKGTRFLKMRFEDESLVQVIEQLVMSLPSLELYNYITPRSFTKIESTNKPKSLSIGPNFHKLSINSSSIKLVDEDLELFEKWLMKGSENRLLVLMGLLNFDSIKRNSAEGYMMAWFKLKNVDESIREIKNDMKALKFSDEQRKWLRALCKNDL